MTRSRVGFLVLSTALLCSLTACGGKDDKSNDLPTLTPEPTKTVSPTLTPTAPSKPTAIPTHTSEKYRDLTLVLNRPAKLDPKAAIPVRRFLEFHQFFATMGSGQPAPADLSKIADPNPVKFLDNVLASDRKAKQRAGGTLTISVTMVRAGAVIAAVDGCFDQSKLLTIRSNGTSFVDPTVKRDPKFPVRVMLSKGTGIWKITEYTFQNGKC